MASSPWSRRPCKRGKPWPLALYRVSTFKETRFEADLSRAQPWPPGLYPLVPFLHLQVDTHRTKSLLFPSLGTVQQIQQLSFLSHSCLFSITPRPRSNLDYREQRRGEEREREDKQLDDNANVDYTAAQRLRAVHLITERREEGAAWIVEVQ